MKMSVLRFFVDMLDETYRSDSNIKLHQNLVGSDQKNTHFAADQSTLSDDLDHLVLVS